MTKDSTRPKVVRLTQRERRSVECPTCSALRRRPCRSSRAPGPNTLGGGWGGALDLDREHPARVAAARTAPREIMLVLSATPTLAKIEATLALKATLVGDAQLNGDALVATASASAPRAE